MNRRQSWTALFVGIILIAGTVGLAAAQPAGELADPLTNSRFYTGSSGTQGVFPGKLICLRCDLRPSEASKAQCAKDGHKYALEIDGDPTIHPLLPGDAAALKQLNAAAHGSEVLVTGTLFPNLGFILVGSVAPKS